MKGNINHKEHQDPLRYPKIMVPLEEEMINVHRRGVKRMVVDITKLTVKQKKSV